MVITVYFGKAAAGKEFSWRTTEKPNPKDPMRGRLSLRHQEALRGMIAESQ